jgi:hypothetical protein
MIHFILNKRQDDGLISELYQLSESDNVRVLMSHNSTGLQGLYQG